MTLDVNLVCSACRRFWHGPPGRLPFGHGHPAYCEDPRHALPRPEPDQIRITTGSPRPLVEVARARRSAPTLAHLGTDPVIRDHVRTLAVVRIGRGDPSRPPVEPVGAPFCGCSGAWRVKTRCDYCKAPGCACRETCPDCFEAKLRAPGRPG